ncbi:MAG: Asp-tRNA(Asn)/Glu-tRNA(Gln) amidotransferase subunit GatC [Betaproteobacteria bacterium]|nr:Asp-tRNA(Asn)/Glu-tRNA(Gln) amidotransferase subunit GatC [Betaproteobacteria bacterium]
MSLSNTDVKRIAQLARIAVSEPEVGEYLRQLEGIFGLIEEMQGVDTEGLSPMSHALDESLRMREDTVTARDQRDLFQTLAPQVEAGLYLVPKVIE